MIKLLSLLPLPVLAMVFPVVTFAQDIKLQPKTGTGFDSLTNLTASGIISGAISLIMLIVALVFFFMLIWGGLKWVMSEGDQKKVEEARNQITNALVGLAIVFAAWAIMKLIETVFGISVLGGLKIPSFQ